MGYAMKRILASVVACVLLATVLLAAQKPLGPGLPEAQPEKGPVLRIEWRTDLAAALKEAADSGRQVLIYFHADWCQPCRMMDAGTFINRPVAQFITDHFIPVRVDDTKDTSDVSKKYAVRLYPSVLFLSSAGEPVHMVLGPRSAAQLYPVLEQVSNLPVLMEKQKKAPEDLEANFAVGNALAILEHLKWAEPYLKKAAELDPGNARGRRSQARLLLALVPLEDGDSAAALKELNQYLMEFDKAPEVPTAMYFIGTVLFRDGKLEESRRMFEGLRTRFPKHLKAYEADKAIDVIDARLRAKARQDKAQQDKAGGAKPPEPAKTGD